MLKKLNINLLTINPGSTSTKVAVYKGGKVCIEKDIPVTAEDRKNCKTMFDEIPFRRKVIIRAVEESGLRIQDLAAIVSRGAPLAPIPSGTYRINKALLDDSRNTGKYVMHISRIGALIADELGAESGIPRFVVDPVSVDELDPVARISGLAEVPRISLTHALNMKMVAKEYAQKKRRPYERLSLITAHLGGGISIALHKGGRMIDAVDANGEGPFSPERSGGLRADSLVDLAFSGKYDRQALKKKIAGEGGFRSLLGTADVREIEARISGGDRKAELIYKAMIYSISKHIGALAVAAKGKTDAILLTGGLARSKKIVSGIENLVGWIARVEIYPGEREMEALYRGAVRVLEKTEKVRIYPEGGFE